MRCLFDSPGVRPAVEAVATVLLKDGTSYSGTVVRTTPAEITVAGDDHTTRTLAVKDIQTVEYDQPPAAPAEQAAQPEQPAPPPAAAPSRRARAITRRSPASSPERTRCRPAPRCR